MLTARERAAVAVVNELLCRCVCRVPVDIFALCARCGVRLVPLSELEREGMSADEVFAVWGNPDGVAMSSARRWTIAYNDRAAERRIRFTLAEELMHLLLGHTEDARFALGVQSYDGETYRRYESEAKHAAAMLLLPPSVYFRFRSLASPAALARLCRVSEACAFTAARWYEENEGELRALFTSRAIFCDRASLVRARPLRPVALDPARVPAAL